jgi:hypothetical protein
MKKIDEALQMKVFDLLEGNLNDQEKAEVLNMIAASAELQKEYDLMSKTYLQDEPIVFADKSKLYRRPGMVLAWSPMMRYAATLTVVAVCGAVTWYFARQNTGTETTVTKTEQRGQENPEKLVDSLAAPAAIPQNQPVFQNPKLGVEEPVVADRTADYRGIEPIYEVKQVIREPHYSTAETRQEAEISEPEIAKVATTDATGISEIEDTAATEVAQQMPVKTSKKRSLSYKLINNGRQMLANLQLPEVKFKAEKNANKTMPTIKMEIRTLKTDVIATLID